MPWYHLNYSNGIFCIKYYFFLVKKSFEFDFKVGTSFDSQCFKFRLYETAPNTQGENLKTSFLFP